MSNEDKLTAFCLTRCMSSVELKYLKQSYLVFSFWTVISLWQMWAVHWSCSHFLFLNLGQPAMLCWLLYQSQNLRASVLPVVVTPSSFPFFSLSFYITKTLCKGDSLPFFSFSHPPTIALWSFSYISGFQPRLYLRITWGSLKNTCVSVPSYIIKLESLDMGPGHLYFLKLPGGYSMQLGPRTIVLEKWVINCFRVDF